VPGNITGVLDEMIAAGQGGLLVRTDEPPAQFFCTGKVAFGASCGVRLIGTALLIPLNNAFGWLF
jgi:hypothetical protein